MSAADQDWLRAPFPYFGGKSRVAAEVWARFGAVKNYVEPFCGSAAVLLGRPDDAQTETINDANCFVANFWRAMQCDPDLVAHHADWPINEADLHARHRRLMLGQDAADFVERMKSDPDYYDARVAGWWVWGSCCWIGSGWCAGGYLSDGEDGASNKLPRVDGVVGVNRDVGVKRPRLTGYAEVGVHADLTQKRPQLQTHGAKGALVEIRRTHLGRPYELQADGNGAALREWFAVLSERLRRVRVCCGDWSRVVTPAVTSYLGVTAVFLDPPYADTAGRYKNIYAVDDLQVAHAVREWAVARGDDPLMRIALCGYEGEHVMPESWSVFAWNTQGGYGHVQKKGNGVANRVRERIWFSPHCVPARQVELAL